MRVLKLTEEEANLLLEYLSLDLEKIGYEDDEIEVLNEIHRKLRGRDN